jgi:signal transduction histidine kinase
MMVPPEHTSEVQTQELTARIAWIIRLRWVAGAGVGATIWLVPPLFGISLQMIPLTLVTLALVVYNGLLWAVRRWVRPAGHGFGLQLFANGQITVDLLFLTALLHLAGGAENPFICYYVFHIVIASILLSRRATYVQVALALALFMGMILSEAGGILPHYHLSGYLGAELYRSATYLAATSIVVGTLLGFTAFMATSIVGRLREREAEIVTLSLSLGERASELQQAYDELRALEREKSEYMRRAAHDLRSPMAAVDVLLAVVEEGRAGEISEKGQEMLQRARRKIAHILDLASDLLTLSHAREAAFEAQLRRVDLAEIVRRSTEEFRPRAESSSVVLDVNAEDGPVVVMGDSGSLNELLDNLISNSIKYTPSGGEVEVTLSKGAEGVVITVRDTGMGIAADDVGQIFNEFYRSQEACESGQDGTGLGLSIVQAIVESHKGTITVDSELGKGSVFRVVLPSAPTPAQSEVAT